MEDAVAHIPVQQSTTGSSGKADESARLLSLLKKSFGLELSDVSANGLMKALGMVQHTLEDPVNLADPIVILAFQAGGAEASWYSKAIA